MNVPQDLKYTKDHEWAKVEGNVITVGITDYAQGELGDVVYVDLPSVGDAVKKEGSFGSIEAVKAVADLFSPASGEIAEINEDIKQSPEIINKDPYGKGWMVKIKLTDVSELDMLMDAKAYQEHIS
ncbi:MAG: glycine cleavage system protein GcvH [Calditrichaceae bacterium]|nr:glycine cleavage system protein GcvH [Calditrichaceae bacterium]MBN2709025.1 glycine cleavage system protein GcvH [Calditrichaceae bacterium]RQV95323.1 MAG: glycine cleavage system protein GcvH [Calditrichota bacterium]